MEFQNPSSLSEAPGAKASRTCGILSIVFSLLCLGIPVGIILGIVALVQQSKARRLAQQYPQEYLAPGATGMVTGIIGLVLPLLMLPFIGIVSAIAIPAMLSQRSRARDMASMNNMQTQLSELLAEYDSSLGTGADPGRIHAAMEEHLKGAQGQNPWNPQIPAYRYEISVVAPGTREQIMDQAQAVATEPGQVVFVVAFSANPSQPGYLAGAVRMGTPNAKQEVSCKAVELD